MLSLKASIFDVDGRLAETERAHLARISHQLLAADPQCHASTVLRSVRVLDVLSSTPARPNCRAPCIHAPLRPLATEPGEKCGLAAFNRAFADAGLGWCWSESLYAELLAGSGSRERLRHYVDNYNPLLPETEAGELLVDRLREEKDRRYANDPIGNQ